MVSLSYRLRYWRHYLRHQAVERLQWHIALRLPRSIALLVFVRVCSATGEAPDDIRYRTTYRAWEQGAGK